MQEGITLGITTRNNGLSDYPENAFNMARYIDDSSNNITQHQIQLAEEIDLIELNGYFQYKPMKIKLHT